MQRELLVRICAVVVVLLLLENEKRHTIDPSYLLSLLCPEGYLLGAVCLLVAATDTCHGSRQRHAMLEILFKRKDCRVQWPDDERQNKLSELTRKQEPTGYS